MVFREILASLKDYYNAKDLPRFFDLQGREVPASTRGLLIRKQGNEVRKVMMR